MLSQDIISLANSLGELAGNVPEKTWRTVDSIRCNLRVIGEQVHQLEAHFVLRQPDNGQEGQDSELPH